MSKPHYETSARRAVAGVIGGGALGALITYAVFIRSIIIFTIAFIVYTSYITVFAVLPWIVLHRMGRRSWRDAMLLAAGVTFILAIAGWAFSGRVVTPLPSRITAPAVVVAAIVFSAVNSLVGFLVWRIAYRRTKSACVPQEL